MIERSERGIEPVIMIENCAGAVDIERRADFLRDSCKIDIFAVKFSITILKRMHVVAAIAAANMQAKASGARRGERLYNLSER